MLHLISVKFIWNIEGSLKVKRSLSSCIIPLSLFLSLWQLRVSQKQETSCLKDSLEAQCVQQGSFTSCQMFSEGGWWVMWNDSLNNNLQVVSSSPPPVLWLTSSQICSVAYRCSQIHSCTSFSGPPHSLSEMNNVYSFVCQKRARKRMYSWKILGSNIDFFPHGWCICNSGKM